MQYDLLISQVFILLWNYYRKTIWKLCVKPWSWNAANADTWLKKNLVFGAGKPEKLQWRVSRKREWKSSPDLPASANYKGHLRRKPGRPFNTTECTKLSRDCQPQETPPFFLCEVPWFHSSHLKILNPLYNIITLDDKNQQQKLPFGSGGGVWNGEPVLSSPSLPVHLAGNREPSWKRCDCGILPANQKGRGQE